MYVGLMLLLLLLMMMVVLQAVEGSCAAVGTPDSLHHDEIW